MKPDSILRYLLPIAVICALALGLFMMPRPAPPTATELAELGVAYVKAGKEPLAREALQEALALEPEHFRANYAAGILAFKQGMDRASEGYLKAALASRPDDLDALLTLGAVYHRTRAYDQAKEAYLAVLRRDDDNVKAIYNLGMLALDQNQLEEGRGYMERYMKLQPGSGDHHEIRARLKAVEEFLQGKGQS